MRGVSPCRCGGNACGRLAGAASGYPHRRPIAIRAGIPGRVRGAREGTATGGDVEVARFSTQNPSTAAMRALVLAVLVAAVTVTQAAAAVPNLPSITVRGTPFEVGTGPLRGAGAAAAMALQQSPLLSNNPRLLRCAGRAGDWRDVPGAVQCVPHRVHGAGQDDPPVLQHHRRLSGGGSTPNNNNRTAT